MVSTGDSHIHPSGIVDLDEDAPDAEFARLDAAGVRGVRVNVSPIHPPEAGLLKKLA